MKPEPLELLLKIPYQGLLRLGPLHEKTNRLLCGGDLDGLRVQAGAGFKPLGKPFGGGCRKGSGYFEDDKFQFIGLRLGLLYRLIGINGRPIVFVAKTAGKDSPGKPRQADKNENGANYFVASFK
jgi:hypothetical protein